jgi:sugar/nucleoside kinase (ribokinase family)
MTILVLGHLVLDEIHTLDGAVYDTPGGITFPLLSFASVAATRDEIVPVFPVGTDAVDVLNDMLRDVPAVRRDGLYEVDAPATRVRLFHESRSRYNTRLVTALPPIDSRRFTPHLDSAQLVYLNMMTGQDIRVEDLGALKAPGRLVYIDLHMVAYSVRHDGLRVPSAGAWEEWVRAADMIQCNSDELHALFGETDDTAIIGRVFESSGLKAAVITHGEQGADIWLSPGERLHVDAVRRSDTLDPTGCGDTFGSVFAYLYAQGAAPGEAARQAATAASFVAGIPGSQGMLGLRTVFGSVA